MGEPSTAGLRFCNIAAYWRARAAKSQNPETRLRKTCARSSVERSGIRLPIQLRVTAARLGNGDRANRVIP